MSYKKLENYSSKKKLENSTTALSSCAPGCTPYYKNAYCCAQKENNNKCSGGALGPPGNIPTDKYICCSSPAWNGPNRNLNGDQWVNAANAANCNEVAACPWPAPACGKATPGNKCHATSKVYGTANWILPQDCHHNLYKSNVCIATWPKR